MLSAGHRLILLLYVFMLPIHYKTSIKVFVVLLFFSLLLAGGEVFRGALLNKFIYPIFYFVVLVLGLFYSENTSAALRIIFDKTFILFAFILILVIGRKTSKVHHVLLTFVAGTLLASLICLVYAVYRDYSEGAYWAYYHMTFTDVINSHPIYMGYFVNFSIVITFFYSLNEESRFKIQGASFYGIVIILFFIAIHILLSGRMPLFAIIFCSLFWVFVNRSYRKVPYQFILIMVIFGGSVLYLLQYRTILFDRFKDVFSKQESMSDTEYGGYVERLTLWGAGINANENILFGVGTGDGEGALIDFYKNYSLDKNYIEEKYNSHNQFIQLYLTNGLVGILAYSMMLFSPIVIALRKKNILKFMFYTPFVFYGITEVFLGRYQGAAFYFFFYAFLILNEDNLLMVNEGKN